MSDEVTWSERHDASAAEISPEPLVVAACRELRPGRALTLGDGSSADDALWLAGQGWRVTAVVPDPLAVGRLQARSAVLGSPVHAVWSAGPDYRPARAGFDRLVVRDLELPPPRWRRALDRWVPGLAAGGTVLLVGHDASGPEEGWTGPPDPQAWTTSGFLSRLLLDLGLRVVRADLVRRGTAGAGVGPVVDHVVAAVRPAA
jgi:hypothetical protein